MADTGSRLNTERHRTHVPRWSYAVQDWFCPLCGEYCEPPEDALPILDVDAEHHEPFGLLPLGPDAE